MDQFPVYTRDCPDGVLEMTITVSQKEADRAGYMHPAELARQIQKLTEAHFGMYYRKTIDDLNDDGLAWIVAWSQMQVARLPKIGETICMRIWAGKRKSVMHTRKYAFYTTGGEPLVTASTLYLLMDRRTRKAADSPEWMRDLPVVVIPGEPGLPKMNMTFPAEFDDFKERRVEACELDYNGHLNNTHYLDWTEALPDEAWLHEHALKSVWVEYSHELHLGQVAGMYYAFRGDCLYVRGVSGDGDSFRLIAQGEADGGKHLQ